MKLIPLGKSILFIFIFSIYSNVHAQSELVSSDKSEFVQINSEVHLQNRSQDTMLILRERWDKAQGTFQIQIVNSRLNPQVDVSVIEIIEKARKQDEIVYLPLMENVRILVLPLSVISSSNHEKLELFKYVQE